MFCLNSFQFLFNNFSENNTQSFAFAYFILVFNSFGATIRSFTSANCADFMRCQTSTEKCNISLAHQERIKYLFAYLSILRKKWGNGGW